MYAIIRNLRFNLQPKKNTTMKIVYTKHFPFKGYAAVNLFGILFVRKDCKDQVDDRMIRHESIHFEQMKEMLWIFFYLWYGIEYLVITFACTYNDQNGHYHEVSFEEEAYNNDMDENYLKDRKHYAWFKYLKLGSNETDNKN